MSIKDKIAAVAAMAAIGLDSALGRLGRGRKRKNTNATIEQLLPVDAAVVTARAVTLEPEITPALGHDRIRVMSLQGRHNRRRRRTRRGHRKTHENFNRRSMLSAPQPQE